MYYIYILLCSDNSLYTGITPDLKQRMRRHAGLQKGGAKYTAAHPPKAIAGLWAAPDRSTASKGEYAIKRLSAEKKRQLIAAPEQIHTVIFPDAPLPLTPCPLPLLEELLK